MPFNQFVWGVGIECSVLPHLKVDQFAWTQHDRQWKEDLRRVRDEVGVRHLRYAIPWQWMEPEAGKFTWEQADQRIDYCKEIGIELMLDVMHFGTPLWLRQAVGDPLFPEALERLTVEMVRRYRDRVSVWCPFNEPLVTALFSGDFGFWPPHSRKWRGYMPVLSRITQATARATRALRAEAPEATVLLCDTAEHYQTRSDGLQAEVAMRNLRRFVVLDLITGKVDSHHPLRPWLTAYGFSELDLDWLQQHPAAPDVIGLDYYPHGEWQLEDSPKGIRQRRADVPVGLYGLASSYFDRYGLPMLVTETSIEGKPINREIWLEQLIDDTRRLRNEGVPMLGLIWWPMIDHLDWDGAMTHRVGKLHEVGLIKLARQGDGTLRRDPTPLLKNFKAMAEAGDGPVGALSFIAAPADMVEDQLPPLADSMGLSAHAQPAPGVSIDPTLTPAITGTGKLSDRTLNRLTSAPSRNGNGSSHGGDDSADRYGIVVFSHLRWGFVWQRPQQFLSRFARKNPVLFIEEPMFDLPDNAEPRLDLHGVMPGVTVSTPHFAQNWNRNPQLPKELRRMARDAINAVNTRNRFDRPLLWYYSPMDAAWSLGQFENRGVVYDCMDELNQFTGAPPELVTQEARLIEHADIVFTGGYELGDKKRQQHDNVHTFGCGVEYAHFSQAQDASLPAPADVDFLPHPVLGWFGVVDERVDYNLLGEIARLRPDWSIAMVGPVVKVDPNHLPHSPNLYWLGSRDYQVLPDYCRAFDVCLMAFALNKATEFINPTKGLEYMATGKPIVGTPVRDVVRQWSDIVYITPPDAKSFIAAVEEALRDGPQGERAQRGLALAKECSWERTVERMQELIAQAISRKERRSAREVAALPEAELAYTYVSTPGS